MTPSSAAAMAAAMSPSSTLARFADGPPFPSVSGASLRTAGFGMTVRVVFLLSKTARVHQSQRYYCLFSFPTCF
jgi:hypothetical protein